MGLLPTARPQAGADPLARAGSSRLCPGLVRRRPRPGAVARPARPGRDTTQLTTHPKRHVQDGATGFHPRVPACSVTTRPQVVAHRGASEDEAEHTLAAYRRALEDGADGLECDVRLTRDGVLVCVHDRRIDRTSSGRGVVSTLELSDLADLDFGAWHRASALAADEAPDWDRTSVLTLERLLEAVRDR